MNDTRHDISVVSPKLLALAKRAVIAMLEKKSEDIDAWARKLANDIKDATD